ncbi:hypothetical protein [Amycolatopsis kentuckyensis]|uniref:hypothetical protein n=1 Tax=Amycolatopsis kentuckyensis TaxID=218823 RepID=UPI003569A4CE
MTRQRWSFEDIPAQHGRACRFTAACNRAEPANLLFAHELDRRLRAAGSPTIAVAGHPGLARTGGGRESGRTGYPELVTSSALPHDDRLRRRLRAASEHLTGVTYLPIHESEASS